jgi:CBS domain-containing protein
MRETQIAGETPVSALMADIIVKVPPTATMLDAVDALRAGDVGLVAVMDGATLLGVVSERDVVGAIAHRRPLDTTLAVDVATKDHLAWCDVDATVTEVANEMSERFIRHVLVEREGKLVGIVSARDLLGFYASEEEVPPDYFG